MLANEFHRYQEWIASFCIVDQWNHIESQTLQVIVAVLGYPLEFNSKYSITKDTTYLCPWRYQTDIPLEGAFLVDRGLLSWCWTVLFIHRERKVALNLTQI